MEMGIARARPHRFRQGLPRTRSDPSLIFLLLATLDERCGSSERDQEWDGPPCERGVFEEDVGGSASMAGESKVNNIL